MDSGLAGRTVKVLDLQCANGHGFEGWFGSGEDFHTRSARGLVECPACGNAHITKKLSAPRLNLGAPRPDDTVTEANLAVMPPHDQALTVAWMEAAKTLLANTDDVGNQFAREARRIHYGESDARGIRGTTTPDEALQLMDEGIPVVPLMLPEALKGPLQ